MNNRELQILKGTIEVLQRNLHSSKIISFGSRATGNNDKYADFDLAVDSKKIPLSLQRKLTEAIEKISDLDKVDLIYLSSVDEEFKKIILKRGKIGYERKRYVRVK